MKSVFSICLALLTSSHLLATTTHVEYLTPPIISESSIDQKIACTRPMREGKFNISAEQKEGKVILHCYGHGGSGCTTSWGSVYKAIDLFEEQFKDHTNKPIHVIGGGIIGLT